jgi:hypothetical protein
MTGPAGAPDRDFDVRSAPANLHGVNGLAAVYLNQALEIPGEADGRSGGYHLLAEPIDRCSTNTVAKKGGDGIGYSGHKHQKGEKILSIIDNNGFVLAPLPVAPVNEADTVLLPEGLSALKRVARLADLKIGGSYLNLDGGFDSRYNRKAIFNAGLIPNIKENPRNREIPKRGRKRLFDAAIHSLQLCVERTFAWEDKFKRLVLRFEFIQQWHYGMKLMAYTLINLRHFCGV